MVNISKDLFNFLYDVVFDDNCAGSPYGLVVELIVVKYGKYIDPNFDNEEYLKGLKKKRFLLIDCKGCIFTEDCETLEKQIQKDQYEEWFICKLKKKKVKLIEK